MTVRHRSRGEGRERSFMRTCGAEKLPWLVVEVEVDAERAGCVAERQVRLGLVGEEATPETSALKDPCERTPIANERARVSVLHAQTHLRCHTPVADRNPWWFDLQSRISETRKVQSFGRVTPCFNQITNKFKAIQHDIPIISQKNAHVHSK
jgi:hypothetical protein